MMKYIKLVFTLLVLGGLVYVLNNSLSLKSTTIPPLGSFLSPYHGYVQSAENSSSYRNQQYNFPGLEAPVKVIYDQNLVPHIYANSVSDAFYVQGYIQAKYRLWQMDITARAAGGRIAEVMGEDRVNYDKLQRRKGMLAGALKNLEVIEQDQETDQHLQQFVDGVNQYISSLTPKDYPIEFKLLDYAPEPYSKLKVALYFKNMEQMLNSREVDLESTNTLSWLGAEMYQELFPDYNPAESPIIPLNQKFDFGVSIDSFQPEPGMIGHIPHIPFEKPDIGVGSNNWAIHPSKTKSGFAIVCNDPHLSLTLPSIWFEVHINTPDVNVYGVTIPGSPGVIIGFNDHIAWGMTNVGQDVADWYKIKWADESKEYYFLDGEKRKVTYKYETYKIKNGSPTYDTIKWTHWGPIVHENEAHPFIDLAYKWIAHDAPQNNQIKTFLNLNSAKNYAEYIQALRSFASPAQNIVFGSSDGDIALRVSGKFPIKKIDQGKFVQDGSSTNNDWHGYIPFEHAALVKNPARGYVSSANQRSTGLDYPYPYHGGFGDYRGRMINRLLDNSEQITVESMMTLQNNSQSLKAEEILPYFLKHIKTNSEAQQKIIAELSAWDYLYDKSATAPIYFDEWYSAYYDMVWDEMHAQSSTKVIRMPESWQTISLTKSQPEHTFFDIDSTSAIETASDIIQKSFELAVSRIDSINDNTWSEYNGLTISHLARLTSFGVPNIETSGHQEAINATSGRRSHGPSWRMIVELKDKVEAHGIFPGGQSGNPSSKFYKNNIQKWATGQYRKLLFLDQDDWTSDQILFSEIITNEK